MTTPTATPSEPSGQQIEPDNAAVADYLLRQLNAKTEEAAVNYGGMQALNKMLQACRDQLEAKHAEVVQVRGELEQLRRMQQAKDDAAKDA